MHFDYRDRWRMWTRDRMAKNPKWSGLFPPTGVSNNTPMFIWHTDFWFNHYCDGFEFKRVKGKVKPLQHNMKVPRYDDGYLIRYCVVCGAKMDNEVQEYFSRALELWKLSRPPN